VDAVGVDANRRPDADDEEFEQVIEQLAPERVPEGPHWQPGSGPHQVLSWAVEVVAKAGTVALIGVYPPTVEQCPIGAAMMKNLTLTMGNCNHRRYIPPLLELVRSGVFDPTAVLTKQEGLQSALKAYEAFDRREPGWLKVELEPSGVRA
jgi:threonine dehydrogenase-like Zn-dependent dehydrogenase